MTPPRLKIWLLDEGLHGKRGSQAFFGTPTFKNRLSPSFPQAVFKVVKNRPYTFPIFASSEK